MFSGNKDVENEEEDIFSFVYTSSKSLNKNSSNSAEKTLSNKAFEETKTSENTNDFLKKNAEIVEESSKKKGKKKVSLKSQNKKQIKKIESKNSYKTNIADEETEYLFNFLKDGNKQKITEATLRKALSTAGITDIDDDFLKVKSTNFFFNKCLENDMYFSRR